MHIAARYSYYYSSGGDVEGETPIQQAHSIAVTDKTETTETVTWENPLSVPDGYIVLYHSGAEVDSLPVDGTDYTAGQEIGTSNFVGAKVLSADPLSVVLGGLTAGTTIHYEVFAYNGSGSGIKYRTTPERGHLWTTDSAPATGMIGTDINAAKTIEVRSGGEDVYYRERATVDDNWGAWTLWDNIPGAEFHSLKCCEGGTIHNAAGTPVSIKWMVNDHSGSAIVYAGYTPGDSLETVITGANAQKWNDGAWNPSTSQYVTVADDGTNRVATLENARTVSYTLVMDGNSIASVCHTDSATIPFLICFKNPGTSGKGIAALISGTWTLRDTTVGKNYHMIRFCPGLGGSDTRVFCSSADNTGNDALWSDDYFATKTVISITGAFGAFAFDADNIILAMFSRTAGADLQITVDGSNFEPIDNPVANIVLFNGVADGNGFNACASSGTSLGIKTTPSNITSAKTWPSYYLDWVAEVEAATFAAPSAAVQLKGRAFIAAIDAISSTFWTDKIERIYIMRQDGDGNTFKVDFKDPVTAGNRLIEVGTNTFTSGAGWAGNGTNGYLRSQFIPSTGWAAADSCGIIWVIGTDQEATVFDFGATGSAGSTQRVLINTHATDDTVASVALNSASVASNANATSVEFWALIRNAVSAILHRGASVFDSSLGALTTRPDRELYIGAHNSNGTAANFTTRQFQLFIILKADITEAQKNLIRTEWLTYIS